MIAEFKTSAKTMDSQTIETSPQLTCYSYAYQMLFQQEPRLKVVNFIKGRSPKIVILEAERKEHDRRRLFYLAQQVLRGIESDVFMPKPTFMCKDCEFGEPCKSWTGNGNGNDNGNGKCYS